MSLRGLLDAGQKATAWNAGLEYTTRKCTFITKATAQKGLQPDMKYNPRKKPGDKHDNQTR